MTQGPYRRPPCMSCLMPMFHFKRIITASNYTVTMIPNHYMLVADPEHPGQWAHRRAVEARYISALDGVWILSAEGKDVISTRILKVTDVYEEGIFAPLTLTGTIVSDDVVASVYSSMLGSERNMHVFCAWGRVLWSVFPQLFKYLHTIGWDPSLSMGVGHIARIMLNDYSDSVRVAMIYQFVRLSGKKSASSERYAICAIYNSREESGVFIVDEVHGGKVFLQDYVAMPIATIGSKVACFELTESNWKGKWTLSAGGEDDIGKPIKRRLVFAPYKAEAASFW